MLLKRYKKQFTLIELLVVIAIISILASMLLPALANAKAAAKTALCLNNQKQLCLVVQMYADEWDDRYLPFDVDFPGEGRTYWPKRISEYGLTPTDVDRNKRNSVFDCPASPVQHTSRTSPGSMATSMGYNPFSGFKNYWPWGTARCYYTPLKITRIVNPSRSIVLGDTAGNRKCVSGAHSHRQYNGNTDYAGKILYANNLAWWYCNVGYYHGNGKHTYTETGVIFGAGAAGNVVYLDGHSKTHVLWTIQDGWFDPGDHADKK